MALEEGTLLRNRYRIEKTIAVGGMGAVYRAIDETLGIAVAVKENFFSSDEFSRQFRREATILASLRHPNLPRVTDHFVFPGQGQYLVMDFIEGVDLRELIARNGTLPEDEVVRIGMLICDALDYLHTRNPAIVHRDIKPGNLKITTPGQVYLVDFGLAKLAQGEATATGAQALTPGYAPPEQYGQGTETRSDIYALGATMYAALTGKIPEDGLSRAMGSAELTSIRKHNPAISERTARAIERAMAITPAERYPDARSFKQALSAAVPEEPTAEASQHLATLAKRKQARPGDTVRETPPSANGGQKPANGGKLSGSNSPTTFDAGGRSSNSIEAAPVETGPKTAAPYMAVQDMAAQDHLPSGDLERKSRRSALPVYLGIGALVVLGGLAAFAYGSGLLSSLLNPQPTNMQTAQVIAGVSTTATPTPTAPPARAHTATFAPTATSAATATSQPTSTLAAPTAIAPAPPTDTPAPQGTPLGGATGQIAYASEQNGSVQIWIMNPDGTNAQQITKLGDGACQPDWSPDGKRLVFTSPCNGKKDEYPGSSLFIINADGTGLIPLDSMPGGDFDPAWSPDGSQIAFTSLRDTTPHIFLYSLADNKVTRLSRMVNRERHPAWSPDGKLLAYQTTRLGQPQIWTMDANGENAQEFSTLAGSFDSNPAWSPDGSVIIFSQSSHMQLMARQTGDRLAQQFAVTTHISPIESARYSVDGWWITFTSTQDGNTDIYRMGKNGGNITRLTQNPGADFHSAWRPAAP